MRKLLLLPILAFALLMSACSAKTTVPTEVTYKSAKLNAEVHCDAGDKGSARFVIRDVQNGGSGAPWVGVPIDLPGVGADGWYDFTNACASGRVPGSGTMSVSGVARNLRSSNTYQYGYQWKEQNGSVHTVGTVTNQPSGPFGDFNTADFPTTPAGNAGRLHSGTGINTRTAYDCTPFTQDTRTWPISNMNCSVNGANYNGLKFALDYINVKWIRDAVWPNWHTTQWNLYEQLNAAGIKGTMGMCDLGAWKNERAACDKKWVDLNARPNIKAFIDAYEGPNEPDLYTPYAGWEADLRGPYFDWMESKMAAVGDANKVLVGPTFTSIAAANRVGPIAKAERGAAHPYPGSTQPGQSQVHGKEYCAITTPGKACQLTEVGYHGQIDGYDQRPDGKIPSGNKGLDQNTRATYTLRYLMESYRHGIVRTDLYKLVTQRLPKADGTCVDHNTSETENPPGPYVDSDDWQMFDCRYQPLPIADAVRNFQLTVGEGNVSNPAAAKVKVTVPDEPYFGKEIVRQPDGDVLVILWRVVNSWNEDTNQPINPAPLTVDYEVPVGTDVKVVKPVDSAAEVAPAVEGKQGVGKDPVILVLRGA